MSEREELQSAAKQGKTARIEKEKQLEAQLAPLKDQLDRERLMRVSEEVLETITSPAFVERMRQARLAADEGGEMDAAASLLSIEALRASGVNIPSDFRMTSRVFEDRQKGFRIAVHSDPLPGSPLGWGACAGGGGLTFCGCGGFST